MADKRKPLISGNWKMNLNHFEAIQTIQKLYWLLKPEDYRSADVSVHPPFTDIRSVQTVLEADQIPIGLGAQNCHWEDSGAFTGEVSSASLMKLNVAYVIAGHSERRELFGETDEVVAKKVATILRQGMTPILCVGETLAEREGQRAEEKVVGQLDGSLASVKKDEIARVVVAYEPIWAIGTGMTATSEDAQGMCKLIRSHLKERYGADVSDVIRIQYGGSVKGANAHELLSQPDVDGALVGGASLDPEDFARIIAAAHD